MYSEIHRISGAHMINAVTQPTVGTPMPPSMPVPPASAPMTPPPTPMTPPIAEPVAPALPPFEPPAETAPMSAPPKKTGMPMKGIIGLLILILTVVGGGAAFYLSQTNQDIRQQASPGDYCTPWSVTCKDGTSNTADCTVQAIFGNDYNRWAKEHCDNGHGGLPGTGGPTVPGSCSGAVECRTYDCPGGMDYNNGQECRSSSVIVQAGTSCPPPASNCGQVDYYTVSGDFDSYCGHNIYTDGCSTPPGGGTTPTNPEKITPTVACTSSSGNQGTFSWKHNSAVEKYILRIDQQNSCTNAAGETIPWFCGTDQGFPNNTGDQYYLLNAADVCSNGNCSIVKSLVPSANYTGASIQWVLPGGSTEADANKMGSSGPFVCTTDTPIACVKIDMVPAAPKYGDMVNLTCATVPNATGYSFFVTEPGQQRRQLPANNNTSSFQVIYTGNHQAQCEVR